MVDAPAIATPIIFSDDGNASATPDGQGPDASPNQEINWALENRVYRSLARCYILEQQKQETREKRIRSVSVALLTTTFFIAMTGFVYSVTR